MSNEGVVRLTREELYERVWSTSINKLAGEFGISNVGLAKVCRRLDVPTPGRGHWARVASGQRVPRPPLPKAPKRAPAWIEFRPHHGPELQVPQGPPREYPEVSVPEDLRGADPRVRDLRHVVDNIDPNAAGEIIIDGTGESALRVTRTSAKRALRLLDGLVKAMTIRGHEFRVDVSLEGEEVKGALNFIIGGETCAVSIVERSERREHVPTPEEKRQMDEFGGRVRRKKYDCVPSGRLALQVRGHGSWSDSSKRSVDTVLGEVVIALEDAAAAERQARHDREVAEQQRKEQLRVAAIDQARRQHQRLLARDLRQMALRWRVAESGRAFLNAVECTVPAGERSEMLRDWLRWAWDYVRVTDPLAAPQDIPKRLEPDLDSIRADGPYARTGTGWGR